MKRTMVALMLALVMALTVIGGVFAEAATLEAQIVGTWDITDIKGNSDGQDLGAAMEMIKAMGGSITMTFNQDGSYSMAYSVMGQSDSQDGTYQISGNQIAMDGTIMNLSVSGDQAVLADLDGAASMTLTRSGSTGSTGSSGGLLTLPEPTAGGSEGLIGRWKIISTEVAENAETYTLPAVVKPYVDLGAVIYMIFDGNNLSMIMEGDSSMDDEAEYTVNGDQITIGDSDQIMTYALEGDNNLVITMNGDKMTLEFVDEPQPVVTDKPVVNSGSVEGTWSITGVTGDDEGAQSFNQMLAMGAVVTMEFADGNASMSYSLLGQSETNDLGAYQDDGSTLTIAGDPCAYTINGDTMTLNLEEGIVMTMVRK